MYSTSLKNLELKKVHEIFTPGKNERFFYYKNMNVEMKKRDIIFINNIDNPLMVICRTDDEEICFETLAIIK